jgi:hypothetical protein
MSNISKLVLLSLSTAMLIACSGGQPQPEAPPSPPDAARSASPAEECAWPPGTTPDAPQACPKDCVWDEKTSGCILRRGIVVQEKPAPAQ